MTTPNISRRCAVVRDLTAVEVEFSVVADYDDVPVRGNVLAGGNDEVDKESEDEILRRMLVTGSKPPRGAGDTAHGVYDVRTTGGSPCAASVWPCPLPSPLPASRRRA
jgi:hypothetical protein